MNYEKIIKVLFDHIIAFISLFGCKKKYFPVIFLKISLIIIIEKLD